METKKEFIQARIPVNSEWGSRELEAKAEELGMNKSEFIINAVDLFYNLDTDVHKEIKANASGLRVPEYIFIQNMIIDILAKSAAEYEVYGINKKRMLPQFMFIDDSEGFRSITGKELFDELKRIEVERIEAEQRKAKTDEEKQNDFNMKIEKLIFKATGIKDPHEQAKYFESIDNNEK